MGLLSHYIAYKFGKKRASKKAERYYSQPDKKDQRCVDYDYCTARGECPDLLQCTYE